MATSRKSLCIACRVPRWCAFVLLASLLLYIVPMSQLAPGATLRINANAHSCLEDLRRAVIGKSPPRAGNFTTHAVTTRLLLLAPDAAEEPPSIEEIVSWLRPGYYTLLVEHPDRSWDNDYATAVKALTLPDAVTAAIENKVGHKYEPAVFAVLPAAKLSCLAAPRAAGVLFAQAHDVETVVYVRHYAQRRLEGWFPRYFLPHQRLPVLDLSAQQPWFTTGARPPASTDEEFAGSELLVQHFERDSRKRGAAISGMPSGALTLCTEPARAVLQYGLCQAASGTADSFLLEEVPPVVARPVHPALGRATPRNILAHRPAFWALALLIEAERHSATDPAATIALERGVHCSLAKLRFDVATLPPGAFCGDPPAEAALARYDPPVSVPDHDAGLQVDYELLTAHPFFGFNPSRAHGPAPRVPVPVDAVPVIDRSHMFRPGSSAECSSANASAIFDILLDCIPPIARQGSDWIKATISSVLQAFLDAETLVARPTPAQLDAHALQNCFNSSHRRRDISISLGYQQFGRRHDPVLDTVVPFHEAWLLNNSLPALAEHYGDAFVSIQASEAWDRLIAQVLHRDCAGLLNPLARAAVSQFYSNGPRVPELNLDPCGGTTEDVERCVGMGLQASFGHLFMVWAADDCLVNFHNLISRDLRRVHTRQPWVWNELYFSQRNVEGYMAGTIQALEQLQQEGLFYPEELSTHKLCMRRDEKGDLSNAYVDSFGLPRATFGRITSMCFPMAYRLVNLEVALPTAMCMTHWGDERVPVRCSYGGPQDVASIASRWHASLDWIHPFKLGKNPELREFLHIIKRNATERPDFYDDFNLRDPVLKKDRKTYACH